jgi:hypothetical protein
MLLCVGRVNINFFLRGGNFRSGDELKNLIVLHSHSHDRVSTTASAATEEKGCIVISHWKIVLLLLLALAAGYSISQKCPSRQRKPKLFLKGIKPPILRGGQGKGEGSTCQTGPPE